MSAGLDVLPALVSLLGWTLMHFVWQGGLIAALLKAVLTVQGDPRGRHASAIVALGTMALAPPMTLLCLLRGGVGSKLGIPSSPPGIVPALVVIGWATGVALLGVRAAIGFARVSRLRRRATPLPPVWLARCAELHRRAGGRAQVFFAQTLELTVPAVVGVLRPTVLVPTSALLSMPVDQLEALILHELAHVMRFDHVVNAAQIVIETLLFFHPATWWVSRTVRTEREHCCDDRAVQLSADVPSYVRALCAVAEAQAAPAALLAANGGELVLRSRRLLAPEQAGPHPVPLTRVAPLRSLLLVAAACFGMSMILAKEDHGSASPGTLQMGWTTTPATKVELIGFSHDDGDRARRRVILDGPRSGIALMVDGRERPVAALDALPGPEIDTVQVVERGTAAAAKLGLPSGRNGLLVTTRSRPSPS